MADSFKIDLTNKPHLYALQEDDKGAFMKIIGTFVNLMEVAAKDEWYKLPETIHSSLQFEDVIVGVLNAVMNTKEIEPSAYQTLEMDLHPLGLLSDKRKNLITGEREVYDWKSHFVMDTNEVTKDTITVIIRKLLYLVRWIDLDTVSKNLVTREFVDLDKYDVAKLPFQPALSYQEKHLGELYVGKFFSDIGAFNLGSIDRDESECPACKVGKLKTVSSGKYKVCPRCNGGWEIENNSID